MSSGNDVIVIGTDRRSIKSKSIVIIDSSFSAIINAPFERIDIPAWCDQVHLYPRS